MSKAYKFTLAQKGFLICQNNIFILYQFFYTYDILQSNGTKKQRKS